MRKFRTLIFLVMVVALVALGYQTGKSRAQEKAPKIDATAISEQISKCSSLTTALLDYRGIVKYTDGEIAFINQKSFSMIYDAHVKAGVDLSQAEVDVSGNTVTVTLPKAEIQDISVDSDSLEFYDEQFALFNWTNKEDTAKAIEYAKEDALKKAQASDILIQASEQAETAITTLLSPLVAQSSDLKLIFKQ